MTDAAYPFRYLATAIIISGQFIINPEPDLKPFWVGFLTKLPFGVASAEVAINCLDYLRI